MRVLINASNIGKGGATQVTDSICCGLGKISDVDFVVVLPSGLAYIGEKISSVKNVRVRIHDINRSAFTKISGREKYLDRIVESEKIDVVLSIFGPSWWVPRCPHLCGFALAHIVMPESPYFKSMGWKERLRSMINISIMKYFFRKCSDNFYTENEMISVRLRKLFHTRVFTVTNYYNQVFDEPSSWEAVTLPDFDGYNFLTISAPYPHKNLKIALDIARYLRCKYPDFRFRFVFTINKNDYPAIPDDLTENFLLTGPVTINQCPSLYEQSYIVFQPTLLECFTASYPEAMRMGRPIVTTSLPFAQGLCGKAASYFDAMSFEDAAEKLYELCENDDLYADIVTQGHRQLAVFDNYNDRVSKLVGICRQIVSY